MTVRTPVVYVTGFRGILPESFSNLKNLKELRLSVKNNFKYDPKIMEQLTSLEHLNIYFKNSTDIPNTLGNIKSLKEIYLEGNTLSILPYDMKNLNSLTSLHLNIKKSSLLPKTILELKSLQMLYLSGKIAKNLVANYVPDETSNYVMNELEKNGVHLYIP